MTAFSRVDDFAACAVGSTVGIKERALTLNSQIYKY